jgi:hypothetical protein
MSKIIIYLLFKETEFQYLFQHGWSSNAILKQNNSVPNFAHNFFKPTVTLSSYLRWILPFGLFISLCTCILIHIRDICIVSDKLQLVKTLRRLADYDVISRAASYSTLTNRRLCGQMHVILSCNNTHLKEVSELTYSKHFVIHERQFVIPKLPSISTTKILDLIHASVAQFTQSRTLRLYREHIYCSPYLFNEGLKRNACFIV